MNHILHYTRFVSIYNILFIFLSLFSCDKKNSFERENQLISFFKNEINSSSKKKEIILVMLIGGCTPCNDSTIKFMKILSQKKQYLNSEKFAVIQKSDRDKKIFLEKIGYKVYVDTLFRVNKYGLTLDKNVAFVISEDYTIYKYVSITSQNYISAISNL